MGNITADKSLSTGIKEIDDQHKKFLDYINSLNELVNKKYNKEKAAGIVHEIYDYAKHHFDTEERYFEKYDYPFAIEHSIEHIKMIEKITALSDRISWDETPKTAKETFEFLKFWQEKHLNTHDKKYVEYFKKKGIKAE